MQLSILTIAAFCTFTNAVSLRKKAINDPSNWSVSQFNSLVAFGDSYTDENRLSYFGGHNGSAPPPGTFLPESFNTAGGARNWVRYVVQYTGTEIGSTFQPQLTLYDYAVSGAVCSNNISLRTFSAIHAPFPAVLEYEIPAFLADMQSDRNGTSEAYFTPALSAADAVYTIWIGTNDVGVYAFLTDSQIPGYTLTDFSDCLFRALDEVYAAGGRYFVVLNQAPLYLTPLYANDPLGGVGNNQYWPNKSSLNHTGIADIMKEYVTTINDVWKYQIPFESIIANRYPGANFALFDVYSLFLDIYNNPTAYLNGTAPANVTGFEHHCSVNGTNCVNLGSPDSFLWYDELHKSEQVDLVIARNFVDVIGGNSRYASYY